MKDGLRCIDSDLHVIEGGDVYERHLNERFRDRMPRYMGLSPTNFPWWIVQDRPIPPWANAEDVVGPQHYLDAPTEAIYGEVRRRGYDAGSALTAMDAE